MEFDKVLQNLGKFATKQGPIVALLSLASKWNEYWRWPWPSLEKKEQAG